MQLSEENQNRRVVITGLGLVTPLGVGVSETWSSLCAGKSGVDEITRFDTKDFNVKIAGEVKNFKAEDYLPKKEARRTEPFIAYAVAAARMALEDSGLKIDSSNENRVGVLTGCGLGGLHIMESNHKVFLKKGSNKISPFFIPHMIGNMAPGMISIQLGAKGPNSSIATACAAGTHAVGDAYKVIKWGGADAMITGGVESVITPLCISGFNAMKALSKRNDEPEKASRPFDQDRDGFVVGEGAGILILESLDNALARNAKIYGELCGFGMSGDAHHISAPAPNGDGAARCMAAAIEDAGIKPEKIEYINAHGTSTKFNDMFETIAIKKVFGDHAKSLMVSSTKSMTGHLLGGSGGIESVFTSLAIHNGEIPPTINLDNPDDDCDLDYVPHVSRKKDVEYAMSNSFGFGGTNACIVIKKYNK